MQKILFFLSVLFISLCVAAQRENLPKTSAGFPINWEEDSIPPYTLPDLLTLNDGTKITSSKTWAEKRRPGLLRQIQEIEYGRMPPRPPSLHFYVFDKGTPVLNGK